MPTQIAEYGTADFQPGMEETEGEAVVPESVLSSEGFSVLQKGLLLAVILGCVAVYVRMSGKKKGRYSEKSLA